MAAISNHKISRCFWIHKFSFISSAPQKNKSKTGANKNLAQIIRKIFLVGGFFGGGFHLDEERFLSPDMIVIIINGGKWVLLLRRSGWKEGRVLLGGEGVCKFSIFYLFASFWWLEKWTRKNIVFFFSLLVLFVFWLILFLFPSFKMVSFNFLI